jgi:spore germination protein GerM
VLVLALAGVLVAGCGVPTMADPQSLPNDLVPQPSSPSESPVESPMPAGQTPSLYFVSGADAVKGVHRAQPERGNPALEAVRLLHELQNGPNEVERAAGLSSAVPPGITLALTSLADGRAVVDIAGDVPGGPGAQAHLLAAQIVLSLTGIPMIESVSLTRNGDSNDASLPDGSLTALPLTRDDYAVLIAR